MRLRTVFVSQLRIGYPAAVLRNERQPHEVKVNTPWPSAVLPHAMLLEPYLRSLYRRPGVEVSLTPRRQVGGGE